MKRLIFILLLLFAILPSALAADQITDKIFAITHYAEQYEMGQISYAQLKVYSNALREDIRLLMSEVVFGNEESERYTGVSAEEAEKFFGEPTEYVDIVWVVNEEHDEHVEKQLPRWEKAVFDGKKIMVTFNAWPQVYKSKDGDKEFYWVDFQIRFKRQFNIDFGAMQSDITALAIEYLNTKSNVQELSKKLVEYSQILEEFIHQNKENCREYMAKLFPEEEKEWDNDLRKWEIDIFKGKNLRMVYWIAVCTDCEWVVLHQWPDAQYEKQDIGAITEETPKPKQIYTIEDLRSKDLGELMDILRKELNYLRTASMSLDERNSRINIVEISKNFNALQRAVTELFNSQPGSVEEKNEMLISALDSVLGEFDVTKTTEHELRYSKRLAKDIVEKKSSFCRQVQEEECSLEEGCIEGECKFALGGKEDCRNLVDDDSDELIDCMDPDCAKQCGRTCKAVCEPECWPCTNQCNSVCKECIKCERKQGGEECNSACEAECWPCRETKCKTQPFCAECKKCEEASFEMPMCEAECNPCNECASQKPEEECRQECKQCVECKSPSENPECMDACKEVTKDYPGQLKPCEDLCRQKVAFYCSESKQYSPCRETTYICNGNMQVIPCEIFNCSDGIMQIVPCDQKAFCGENQVADGEKCKCRAGFHDCDGDGNVCESENPCGKEAETCDDGQDNDDDYLVDCDDRMDCMMGIICGIGKVCFDGKCLLQEEANVSIRCKENQTYVEGECKCIEGYVEFENMCVPSLIKLECKEGFVEVEGKCAPKVENSTECPEGFEFKGNRCMQNEFLVEPNMTECPEPDFHIFKEGVCIAKVIKCPKGYDLLDGQCIINQTLECPEGYELKGNECMFVGEKIECTENEVLDSGKCISKDVFEGVDVRPGETGKKCELIADCGNEREICSNGFCKRIPDEIYEKEYGGDEAGQVIINEPEVTVPEIVTHEESAEMQAPEEPVEETKKTAREEMREEKEDKAEEREEKENVGEVMEQPEVESTVKEEIKEEKSEEKGDPEMESSSESPAEQSVQEPQQEQSSEGVTGAFAWLTGFATKEKKCSADEDCKPNQNCDKVMGQCNCKEGWVDCNSMMNGNDDDGCESEDLTCGGQREICEGGCNENQRCNEEKGYCDCNIGFFDCDGNWLNGCESKKQCTMCKTDDDCSNPVCTPWNNNILKFGCMQGESWTEENGAVAFAGECKGKSTGVIESHLVFDSWGDAFAEVNAARDIFGRGSWCAFELETTLKERKEFEEGLNKEFLSWFFDDYLISEPDKWENRIGGIYDIYWGLVENAKQTARASACLGAVPPAYNPIDITFESGFGKVHIWEEMKKFDEFKVEVLSPYMEIWIFPPKDIIKGDLLKARDNGYMPGPPEQRLQEIGPSMKEKEDVKRNPEALKEIEDIAKDFGGSLDGLVTVSDNGEDLFYLKIAVNPDVIFKGQPVKTIDFEPDVKVTVQLDFLYDVIKKTEQHGEIESPPWDSRRRVRDMLSNALDKGMIVAKITGALATGDIKVEPLSAVPKVLKVISMAAEDEEKKP